MKNLQFKIEQLAVMTLSTNDSSLAKNLLVAIGLDEWIIDQVQAHGMIRCGEEPHDNIADLEFNYQSQPYDKKPLELELLHYTDGNHWLRDDPTLQRNGCCVSHIGMHVTSEELEEWKELLLNKFGLQIAQEVYTQKHTNSFLVENGRKYHYTIFDTRRFIGFDLKFIVRIDPPSFSEIQRQHDNAQ